MDTLPVVLLQELSDFVRAHSLDPELAVELAQLLGRLSASAASDAAPMDATPPEDRYRELAKLGEGGMGEVRRVYDARLDRAVVRKTLRWELLDDVDMRTRFVREARLTAGLQHPGVPPVHDMGIARDGRPWMIMREVRGQTMRQAMDATGAGGGATVPLRRWITWFTRACEAVAYAHGQGILHGDLKPENIMIDAHGEVLVVDWGLARRVGAETAQAGEFKTPKDRTEQETQGDKILGTPLYVPPERFAGAPADPRGDVFALGAVLYEILSGSPPQYPGRGTLLERVRRGPPRDVAQVARACPPELASLVREAMAWRPEARLRDAEILALRLNAWLDGVRRRADADEIVQQAQVLTPGLEALRDEARRYRAGARALLDAIRIEKVTVSPEKEEAWRLDDLAGERERQLGEQTAEHLRLLQAALIVDPANPGAHACFAAHQRRALQEAELRGDREGAALAEAGLRAHDRGEHVAWLVGDGALTLHTEPPGARVTLYTIQEHQRQLRPVLSRELGETPLVEVVVPRGSHIVRVQHPDRLAAIVPFSLERQERLVHGPGEAPWSLVLPERGGFEGDVCFVPAGWCVVGGDPIAVDAWPRTRVWVDSFALRRDPVSNAEYLSFLNALIAGGDDVSALEAVPRATRSGAGEGDAAPIYSRDTDGHFILKGSEGLGWAPEHPVTQVTWWAAMAFAAWWSAQTGQTWRLPHAVEREKAARGADGRGWPWGNNDDETWCCCMPAHRGVPARVAPEAYPLDVSVFGVRGLAGNVRDWCWNRWERSPSFLKSGRLVIEGPPDDQGLREVRGGAWSAQPHFCRPAGRFALDPGERLGSCGFRLARSLSG